MRMENIVHGISVYSIKECIFPLLFFAAVAKVTNFYTQKCEAQHPRDVNVTKQNLIDNWFSKEVKTEPRLH
jgi:hypothetical protein